jgi:hypothetical protein
LNGPEPEPLWIVELDDTRVRTTFGPTDGGGATPSFIAPVPEFETAFTLAAGAKRDGAEGRESKGDAPETTGAFPWNRDADPFRLITGFIIFVFGNGGFPVRAKTSLSPF